jgi:hypothetical protein
MEPLLWYVESSPFCNIFQVLSKICAGFSIWFFFIYQNSQLHIMKPNIQKQSLGSFLTLSQQQTQHHETKYLNKNTLPASPIHDTCLEVWYQQCMDMLIKQHSDLKTKTNNIPNHYSNFIQSKCEKKNF